MARSIFVQVEDIGCTGCASDLEKILLDVDGILSVEIGYSEDMIKIEYDPDLLDEEQIVAIIRRVGLKPRKSEVIDHRREGHLS